jgi:predicted NBD/HSP70 family sugar kinase
MPDLTRRLRPSAGVLRGMTDRTVLDQVLAGGRVTRAQVAVDTGLSKPTVSSAFTRLEEGGLIAPAGARTGLRGRVATYYELAPTAGWVLAVDVDPDGVRTRSCDLAGTTFDEHLHPPVEHGDAAAMVRRIRAAVRRSVRVGEAEHGPVRAVTMSVANAVDPATGRILALPEAPFAEGVVEPARIFADLVPVPVFVDNHVNCAVIAEHSSGAAVGYDDVAYVFVGAGIGAGLLIGGRLVRGAHGLAGEIGYLAAATGPSQYATVAAALRSRGFGVEGTNAIDVEAIEASLASADGRADEAVQAIGAAIGQVVVDTCAVVDPALVVLGGRLGRLPALLPIAQETVAAISPAPVRLEVGWLGATAPVQGGLQMALEHAHARLLDPAALGG